jgi:hypothetical protein
MAQRFATLAAETAYPEIRDRLLRTAEDFRQLAEGTVSVDAVTVTTC